MRYVIVPHSPPQMLKQRFVSPVPDTSGNMHSLFSCVYVNPAVQHGITVTLQRKTEARTTIIVHWAGSTMSGLGHLIHFLSRETEAWRGGVTCRRTPDR